MSFYRPTSACQHSNSSIFHPASSTESSRVSEDDLYSHLGSGSRPRPGCSTMNDPISDKKLELQVFGSENQMSKLQGLSNLLYTRGRLQELGCTFNELGKLLTYGDPSSLREWDQLLRLGPIYDEQWAIFFAASLDPQNNSNDNMWPDLRTLKRVLANEGVTFGRQHRRLTRGDQSNKLLRLCAAYDDLFKLWFTMATEGTSYRVTTTIDECEEDDLNESIDDSGCFMDEYHERAHTDPEASIDEDPEHVSASLGISTTSMDEPNPTQHQTHSQTKVPKNLGWRFSEDVDPTTVARNRDSIDSDTYSGMEDDFEIADSIPLITVEVTTPLRAPSPIQPNRVQPPVPPPTIRDTLQPAKGLRHGPSPLQVSLNSIQLYPPKELIEVQNVFTHSMLLHEELLANPRGDNLKVDANMMAAIDTILDTEAAETKPTHKRSIKGWLRGVFHKSSKVEPREPVQLAGGWW